MKKIILALLVVLPFLSRAQSAGNDTTLYIYYKYTYGNALDRYWAKKVLVLPNDTIYSKDGLSVKAGVLYVGNGIKWSLVTGGGGGGGGGFTIADTGYTRLLVSPFLLQKTIDSMKIVNDGRYFQKADTGYTKTLATPELVKKKTDSLSGIYDGKYILKTDTGYGHTVATPQLVAKKTDSVQALLSALIALKLGRADTVGNLNAATNGHINKVADSLATLFLKKSDSVKGTDFASRNWLYKVVDSLSALVDTTKIRYYGTGDTTLRAGGKFLLSALIRDSLGLHIRINPDSSLTFYAITGSADSTLFYTVYRSDTSRRNIYAAIAAVSLSSGAYYPPLDSVLWKGPISARNMQVAGIKSTGQDTLTATTYSEAYDRVVVQDTIPAAGNGKLYRRKMQTVDMTGAKTGLWPIYQSSTGTFTFANDTTMNLGNWTYHSGIQPGGKTLNFLGDSWTAGSGASSPTTTSFPAIVSGATGATMGQYGVPGMTLETDGTGNNYQGVPSIIQRLSTIPNNSTSTAGIILEFGLNDLPPVGSYNPAHLASALDTLLRHVIDTAHYTRRQVAVMGMPWIPDATLTYYGTISGGTAPTRARLKQYDSVIQAACIKWGVSYIPCYYQLKDNMNDSSHYVTTGQLHLDDAGHKFYGYNIIQKLSLQTGSPWSQSGSTIQAVTTPANVNLSTSGTGVATSTPNYMDWGDRYGIVEGPAQLKAIFYNDGTVNNRFGVGVYSGKMLFHAGGNSTVMDFWIGGNPYLSLSTSAFTLNGATQNKFQLRNTTSSGTATPDQVNAGGTFLNSGVFDSSKTKLAWYQSSSSAFGGVGINNTNSYFVTPHGFPFALMYDNTSSLIVDKFLTASNYASFGNGLLFDTTNNKLLTINQTTGKINQTYWAGINWGAGGGSGYTTLQNNTSSVTARAKINLPSGSGLTATDNSGNTSSDLTITSIPSSATATTQTAGDNSTKVSTTAYVDGQVSSGTYTPTLTNTTNITTSGVNRATYTKNGSQIHVMVDCSLTPTATSTASVLTITLPFSTATTQGNMGQGTIGYNSGNLYNNGLVIYATSTTVTLKFISAASFAGSSANVSLSFDYSL